jgi:hypothetical protein
VRVIEHLRIGEAGVIVDHDVHVFPASHSAQTTLAAGAPLGGSAARHAMPGAPDAAELLDVDVDELAGMTALVAVGRLRRLEP